MGEFEVELSSDDGYVVDDGTKKSVHIGRKVEADQPVVVSAAGRGAFA